MGVAGGGGGGGGGGGAGILMEELQVAKSERDQAVADNRSLKHSVDSLRKSREVRSGRGGGRGEISVMHSAVSCV